MNNFQRIFGGGRRAAASAAQSPSLATLIGALVPRDLLASDFAAGQQFANAPSAAAVFTVPRGDVHQVMTGRPLRMYLGVRHAVSITPAAAVTTGVVDLSTLGGLVRSTRPAPGFPTQAHPDVRATVGGSAANVTAVDFAAGTVTVGGLTPEAANAVVVEFLPAVGTVQLRAEAPTGLDVHTVELYNNTLRGLHETDQASGVTAPRINRPGLVGLAMGPKWRLVIEVTSPNLIPWGGSISPLTQLQLPGQRAPVVTGDERALSQVLAALLRGA